VLEFEPQIRVNPGMPLSIFKERCMTSIFPLEGNDYIYHLFALLSSGKLVAVGPFDRKTSLPDFAIPNAVRGSAFQSNMSL
jgi:hypothetical protein